jgi:hypothetical protein
VSPKDRQSKNVSKNQEILVRLLPLPEDAVGACEDSGGLAGEICFAVVRIRRFTSVQQES